MNTLRDCADAADPVILGLALQVTALTDCLAAGGSAQTAPSIALSLATDLIAPACHAELSAWCHGQFHLVATDPRYPQPLHTVRADTGEGPGHDAVSQSIPVLGADLADDPRWRRYGPEVVRRTGVRSALSYGVRLSAGRPGIFSLYSDWPHGFDDAAVATAAVMAATLSLAALVDPCGACGP